jgi:N,N'-diacetyllegionaminate synthase
MTYIVAEIGVNHNGDIELAKALIEMSCDLGANAVKFQSFNSSRLASPKTPKALYQEKNDGGGYQQEMLKRLELSYDSLYLLYEHSNSVGIDFMSSPFGIDEVDSLMGIKQPAIKVPSGEITYIQYIKHVGTKAKEFGIPIFLSTGMSTLSDIDCAINILVDLGISRNDITLLHCVSSYPAPDNDLNLKAIETLRASFKCPVGYSDHSNGIVAPIVAVSLGATVIEKHLTMDRSLPGPDHAASLEPNEFKDMVKSIRRCENILGDGIKKPMPSEINTREVARRSIRAARKLLKGTVYKEEDLIIQRPGDGMPPSNLLQVLGREAKRDFNIGEAIEI